MLNEAPDSTCTLSAAGSEVAVAVCAQRTVWYEFDTSATDPKLALPYAVAVDGKVLPEFAQKAHALSKTNRTITLKVKRGATVALYLNSDAHPSYRNYPVYQIRVGERDALVKITEQKGRLSHLSAEAGFPYEGERNGRPIDSYRATLTGDIWMRISHIYTESELASLLAPDTDPAILSAVKSICRGLPTRELTLAFSARAPLPASRLRVVFEEQESVKQNTAHCPLLTHILPRTHPWGFVAVFEAARAAGLTEVRVASCWRTSLGSIAHRAGLGLDVSYLEADAEHVVLNREGLTRRNGAPSRTVSSEERTAYSAFETAKVEAQTRNAELAKAHLDVAHATDATTRQQSEEKLKNAIARAQAAESNKERTKDEWNRIRDERTPVSVKRFREHLAGNDRVSQLFDPWYIDINTHDGKVAAANEQKTPLEILHRNHVHVTVREPKLL